MSPSQPSNTVASVRQRLLNRSKERGEDFNVTLAQYAVERLLYRLSVSEYAEQFVLKGAMLFAVWTGRPYRSTRDLDLLGYGDPSPQRLTEVFRNICQIESEPDGLTFDSESIRMAEIREDQEYEGQRVRLVAHLGNARIPVQIDIGFGDVVTPPAGEIEYPTLLGLSAPRIRAYPRETFIAEKLQAIVALGMPNSRMKDFYDLWIMARAFPFEGSTLTDAIRATFKQRKTSIPREVPTGLSEAFGTDRDKATQWKAFLRRNNLGDAEFPRVLEELRGFFGPPLRAAASGAAFEKSWGIGGPWS